MTTLAETITQTNYYKQLTCPVQRTQIISLHNRKQIAHGLEVVKYTSFDKWVSIHKPSGGVKAVVGELRGG